MNGPPIPLYNPVLDAAGTMRRRTEEFIEDIELAIKAYKTSTNFDVMEIRITYDPFKVSARVRMR